MNIMVIVLSAIIFCALFTVIVFATTGKNVTTQIHNYPPEIQEEYFKTHERIPTEPLSLKVIVTKSIGILVFVAILLGLSIFAGILIGLVVAVLVGAILAFIF